MNDENDYQNYEYDEYAYEEDIDDNIYKNNSQYSLSEYSLNTNDKLSSNFIDNNLNKISRLEKKTSNSYRIIKADELDIERNELIKKNDDYSFIDSRDKFILILIHYNWDASRLIDNWFNDLDLLAHY